MSFDPKCIELAQHFLAGESRLTPADAQDLAQCIQDAIEDWIRVKLVTPDEHILSRDCWCQPEVVKP